MWYRTAVHWLILDGAIRFARMVASEPTPADRELLAVLAQQVADGAFDGDVRDWFTRTRGPACRTRS
jgi:hypothetical protein